jgi:hypothetical protein
MPGGGYLPLPPLSMLSRHSLNLIAYGFGAQTNQAAK